MVPLAEPLDLGLNHKTFLCAKEDSYLPGTAGLKSEDSPLGGLLKIAFKFRTQRAHAEFLDVSQNTPEKSLTMYINSMPIKKDNSIFLNL